jgi:DNA-binding transcriptional ArsR family regulator
MSEECRQVLELLASGKVTIEQANQLLDALGEEHASEANDRAAAEQHSARRPPGLSPDLLVQLTAVSGDAAYIAQLRDLGLTDLPQELLVELTAVSGDVAYIKKLRDLELTDLPRELLVQLTAVRGDAAYIKELRDSGLTEDLPPELLVQLMAVGADVRYIRELRDAGLIEISHKQLEDLKGRGVAAAYGQEVGG